MTDSNEYADILNVSESRSRGYSISIGPGYIMSPETNIKLQICSD